MESFSLPQLDLPALVREAIEAYQLPITAHRPQVAQPVFDPSFTGDRAKLRVILDTRVSNAVKFTPDGGASPCAPIATATTC